jgi:hypothetical protein
MSMSSCCNRVLQTSGVLHGTPPLAVVLYFCAPLVRAGIVPNKKKPFYSGFADSEGLLPRRSVQFEMSRCQFETRRHRGAVAGEQGSVQLRPAVPEQGPVQPLQFHGVQVECRGEDGGLLPPCLCHDATLGVGDELPQSSRSRSEIVWLFSCPSAS